jgi:hypothetical protein
MFMIAGSRKTGRIVSGFRRIIQSLVIIIFGYASPGIIFPIPISHSILNQELYALGTAAAEEEKIIYVPAEVSSLQTAIKQIPDGGIIELAAGTYENSGKAYSISNTNKGFTIRAAPGAAVTLTGKNAHDVLRYNNSSLDKGKMVIFEGLTFAFGYTTTDGVAAGITMRYAMATFLNCIFRENFGNQATTGGGAIIVGDQSLAYFTNSQWLNNRAKFYGAGLDIASNSQVTLIGGQFINNRVNDANHHPYSSGGGIHAFDSRLYIYNSHFEDNQAGYVGGAIYATGIWQDPIDQPKMVVSIDNSTFLNNQARRDASVSLSYPTEGGGVHAEDQTSMTITNSRFITNRSDTGGGVNLYRARVEILNSVFLGNQAVGPGPKQAFGGAVSAISNDVSNSSTNNGKINRPSAHLTLKNVYIQGQYGSVTDTALAAGGVYASGDTNRQYGIDVPQVDNLSANRAKVILENVIFDDLDVRTNNQQQGTGTGGALLMDMAEIDLKGVLVIRSDASGDYGQGGGLMFINQSLARVDATTIAKNTATLYGAGVFLQGSQIDMRNSQVFENEISPGTNESVGQSYGAGIFTAPDDGRSLWAIGEVRDSILSSNIGLPLFDDDNNNYPINEVRYNNNRFFNNTFADLVYADALSSNYRVNANGLNNLVISRSNGTNTDKSIHPNFQESQAIILGKITAIPPVIYPTLGSPTIYLSFAWSGGTAKLNGTTVTGNAGSMTVYTPGTYTLSVNGINFQVQVTEIKPNLFIPLVGK